MPNHEIDIDGFYSRRKILGSVECNASTGQPLPSPPSRPFKEFLLTLTSFFLRSFLFSFFLSAGGRKIARCYFDPARYYTGVSLSNPRIRPSGITNRGKFRAVGGKTKKPVMYAVDGRLIDRWRTNP